MQYFIYSIVIFLSTLLGAFVGLGGGVIIKPMLDVLHMHTLSEIAFFSSCAVFAMSVTSTAKYLKKGVTFEKRILFPLSAGAVLGGFLGNSAFSAALQSAKSRELLNPVGILCAGLLLGTAAAFLGIGGGPINVAALTLLFSFSVRDAAVYSVAVIFFSQLSNLSVQLLRGGVQGYDLKMLWVVIPCAVVGGLLGALLNGRCRGRQKRGFCSKIPLPVSLSVALRARPYKRGNTRRNADATGTVCLCPKLSNRLPPILMKRDMKPPMSVNGIWRPTVCRMSGCIVKKRRFQKICRANIRIGGVPPMFWSLLRTAMTAISSTATATALILKATAQTVSTILH